MSNIQINSNTTGYGTPLLNFQVESLSIKEKSNPKYGEQLAQSFMAWVNGGSSNYFFVRNARWRTNRDYANGRINMQRYMDLLQFNGKENYININWLPIHVVNRIISGLVGRWMQRNEKIVVTATDSLSTKEKQEQYEELEFIIENRERLEKLQAESGVQMIPQDDSLPADKEQLLLWKEKSQRLPEEIGYEMGCNDVLASCGWFDVLKEKMLHDAAEVGFVGTYTWMDAEGVIHVEWLKPENCFYSYSAFEDFRDTTLRGYMRTLKVSELRKKYSKEFNPDNPLALTEEKLFEIAKTAKEYQLYDNLTWNTQWNVSYWRPYDEWNVYAFEFEVKTVDTESYTVVTTKKNGSTIIKKGKPNKPKDNEQVYDDSKINIYRGVYLRDTQTIVEWGLKKNMIRPQDPKEIGNAEFSYSFYMVQNYDMTCLGIPEKIQESADMMIITKLKIQQCIAASRPPGTLVNWDALQNIDYGLGEANKTIDVKKLFDQTGTLYYRGRDAEGNPIPVPITESPNVGFAPQMQALMEAYRFHYSVMRDELGEDPNLIMQAVQPRVTSENVEVSQSQAEAATNYYYSAYSRCMDDTAKKISCLLKDSVEAGAKVYRHIIKQDDVKDRIFSCRIQLLPTAVEIQKFEALLNQALATNPDLVSHLDPFQLMRIAKEDVKLAETIFRQAQKSMLRFQQQMQQQQMQMTIQGQQDSARIAEEEKRKTKEMEVEADIKKGQMTALAQNQSAVLNMFAALMKPTGESGVIPQIPNELRPLWQAVQENIMVGAVAQTEEQKQAIIQQMQMARQMQEQQGQPQMEQQNQIQQPQQGQPIAA